MNKVITFFYEVKSEINKVTWPRQDELIGTTIVVFILVIFFAVLLGIMDYSFSMFIKYLFGGRGLV
jgi:preprotein translocase subunit SecE